MSPIVGMDSLADSRHISRTRVAMARRKGNEVIKTGEQLTTVDNRALSERDICIKFIRPALRKAGWDEMRQSTKR